MAKPNWIAAILVWHLWKNQFWSNLTKFSSSSLFVFPHLWGDEFPCLMFSANTLFAKHTLLRRSGFIFNVILCRLYKRSLRWRLKRGMAYCLPQSQREGERCRTFEQPLLPASSFSHDRPAKCQWRCDCVVVCGHKTYPKDDAPGTVQSLNAELTQALVVLSPAYSDGMTLAKIEADMIAWKRKTVEQTIFTFFLPQGS